MQRIQGLVQPSACPGAGPVGPHTKALAVSAPGLAVSQALVEPWAWPGMLLGPQLEQPHLHKALRSPPKAPAS